MCLYMGASCNAVSAASLPGVNKRIEAARQATAHNNQRMASLELWDRWASLADIWWARHGGVRAADAGKERLQALIDFTRVHSPFYERRWRGLPHGDIALADLPVVRKPELMAAFDDWVTDPRIRRADVARFIETHEVGERFLDRYVVFQSSGTTGAPGLFVQDGHALAVYDALVTSQMGDAWLARAMIGAGGSGAALIAATHGHFASIVAWNQSRRFYGKGRAQAFSVLEPLERLVDALDRASPAFVASYPSVLALLAGERRADRLHARPAVLWSGGELLAPAVRARIERAFAAPVVNEYGASECLDIAASCEAGHLHVHADWVIVEPVDARHLPVRPGETAHTLLITNLANWVQPIVRYDLGDRVKLLEGPCPCGRTLPALAVEGRTDDTLRLRPRRGAAIRLAPMALASVVDDLASVHRFQIVQTSADALALRLPGENRAAEWKRARPALHAWLESQGLGNVRVALDRAAPRQSRRSGKLRTVVALDARED
jgi:phenylacetate-coenzyme A ligase PaaK-like adenylate-forming protein